VPEAQGCTVYELQNVNFMRELQGLPPVKLCDGCKTNATHNIESGRDGGRNDRYWSSGIVDEDCLCENDDPDCSDCDGLGFYQAECPDCGGEGYVEEQP
jgi:hypothetical protein